MQKIGIICEYNPFHNGHIYHIEKIKEKFPDSFITLVLSTCFTQRGEISLLTKWEKTKLALKYKVDLVIELPFFYTTQSADVFASASVKLLEELKMDYLIFGSESNDIESLKNVTRTILYHKEYDNLVKKYLDSGNNYPSSMARALYHLTGIKLNTSNDLLGISYIKAIFWNEYQIKPLTIKRTNNYLNTKLTNDISSATSIRKALFENKDIEKYVPKETFELIKNKKDCLDNYFYLLKYKLINEINELDKYLDVSEGIDKRIKKIITKVNSYEELLDKIKTKRYTYNRLNRMFLHILFNISKDFKPDINYIRVLGFNQKGKLYLKNLKKEINLPIVTNYKDTDDQVLKLELKITLLYLQITKQEHLINEELKSVPVNLL